MNKIKLMRNNSRKNRKLSIFKHGNAKMEWVSIKEFSLLKEAIANSEELCLKKAGLRMKMSGLLTMILNGLPEFAISTI